MNMTEDLQSARLNCLTSDAKRGRAALAQRILPPVLLPDLRLELVAQGAEAAADRLLAGSTDCPDRAGQRQICTVGFYKARDCETTSCALCSSAACASWAETCQQTCLSLIWKPMTNGEWRLFVLATATADGDVAPADYLGFRRLLDL
uniref:ShKT domain-containing protein n=1 Tax=Macrostomum lignano TaxID=282301 RepID=A0A1I8FMV4_9PLAT